MRAGVAIVVVVIATIVVILQYRFNDDGDCSDDCHGSNINFC